MEDPSDRVYGLNLIEVRLGLQADAGPRPRMENRFLLTHTLVINGIDILLGQKLNGFIIAAAACVLSPGAPDKPILLQTRMATQQMVSVMGPGFALDA